jgi:hypothetical protein
MEPMNATARTLFVLLLGSGFAGTALAAMDSAQTTQDSQPAGHMSQKLHDDLTKAGFTDITIMPQSLLVRAKDAQGNSVMMVINPDTLTEVTQQGTPGAAAKPKEALWPAQFKVRRTAAFRRQRPNNKGGWPL